MLSHVEQNQVLTNKSEASHTKGDLTRLKNKFVKANSQKKALQTMCKREGQEIKELHQKLHEAQTAEAETRTVYLQLRSAQRQNTKKYVRQNRKRLMGWLVAQMVS